jgi:signal transduction histidine kinase
MSAARHTPPNGTILIGLAENADRTIVTLSVDDSGSGISEGLAQEIFQRFSRDPGQTSGSGLGLAIVADIAQVHAGHATLVPTPTPAACSHIEFPIHATAPQG